MHFDRRVWKTGVLALAATAIFAVTAFRAEEWAVNLGAGDVPSIVPQIVSGSYDGGTTEYATVITITNTEESVVRVAGTFYDVSGKPSTLGYSVNGVDGRVQDGVLESLALEPKEVLVVRTPQVATGTTNWARIVTSDSAVVSSYFELRDGATKAMLARVSLPPSPTNLSNFVIPRVSDANTGLDVGFALVNTGSTAAEITITARDALGDIIAAKSQTLPPLSHTAQFVREYFNLSAEPADTVYGSVTFVSTAAQFAVLPLSVERGVLSSVPFERF